MVYPFKINTINTGSESQFKEKGSLFIGQTFPIQNSDEADRILSETRKKYFDATHVCYAHTFIGQDNFQYSDDGEPNGTAGIRILNVIKHFQLSNILIVSIRYFGGTKLGVGALGKAYYNSALSAIDKTYIISRENYSEIIIEFEYDMTSHVHHFINYFHAKSIQNIFDEAPKVKCLIKLSDVQKLSDELLLISKGVIRIILLNENIYI